MLLQKGDLGPESSWSEASSAAANGRATRRKRRGIARRRRDAMEATVDDCLGTKRSFSEKDFCFSFSFFLNFFIFKFFFYFSFLCFKVCGGASLSVSLPSPPHWRKTRLERGKGRDGFQKGVGGRLKKRGVHAQ